MEPRVWVKEQRLKQLRMPTESHYSLLHVVTSVSILFW